MGETLSAKGIICDLKPVGGWRFPQQFNGSFTMVLPEHAPEGHYPNKGEKLLAAVRLFRQTHGLEAGEPELDVATFIRGASPQNDYYHGKVPDVIGKPRVRDIKPMIESLREWIDATLPLKPRLVGSPDATDRAMICFKCPQNIKWATRCGECNTAVEQRAVMLRAEVNFELDPGLLACRLHKLALQAAVFIDRDYLPERHPDAPEYCWMPNP